MRKVGILSLLGAGMLGALVWLGVPVVAVQPKAATRGAPDAGTAARLPAAGPRSRQVLPASPPTVARPTPIVDESAFMVDLRVLSEMDAELAVERAIEGAGRFGNSEDAPERRSILIHALASTARAAEARGEAERMVNECPDSGWVQEIERFTGAHRHRNVRLAANGQLEYE